MDFEKECLISLNAYHRISPGSFFRRKLKKDEIKNARNSLVFVGFCRLAPLANAKKEYLVILKMIEQNIEEFYCMLASGDNKQLSCRFSDARKAASKKTMETFEKYFREEEKKV
jgi:hypothetical protein